MADRTYVYIDGESHFIRSEQAWRALHGQGADLGQLRYITQSDDALVLVEPKAHVFWTRKMNPGVDRTIYFTAAACDDNTMHEYKVRLRSFDLDPHILKEPRNLADRRRNYLSNSHIIEKPKGVDIALAVRMLEDASSSYNTFDVCHLYTSDVDFEPLIKAVMAHGKKVFVHGYANGLADMSPLLHVPDKFYDLTGMLKDECRLVPNGATRLL